MTRDEREAAVDWFAEQMKAKLRDARNEAKPDWRDEPLKSLLFALSHEVIELDVELQDSKRGNRDYDAIIKEAADVANFAMMIADRAHLLSGR